MPESDPILIEATRGALVESVHRGAAAVVDATGRIVVRWGDIGRPIYPRSALKPVQAIALIESGAADAYALGAKELALACASHHGEAAHVAGVAQWLDRLGLAVADLECGAHAPVNAAAAKALLLAGEEPTALHNNCSGKHAGFLSAARHRGEPTRGYIKPEHPAQQRVLALIEAMSELDLSRAPRGTDGCGIPVIGMPLAGLALALARMADPRNLPEARAGAARKLLAAMTSEPVMASGSTGFAHTALSLAEAGLCLKAGAEGVYVAALPRLGLGIALKIENGSSRAAETAMAAILLRLGALDDRARSALGRWLRPEIRNVVGLAVGELRPSAALSG